jgi:rifampicin phosphotransferase
MQDTHTDRRAWIPLSEVGLAQVAEVGGKAARLGELVRAGFAVPDGFVIPASLCGQELETAAAIVAGLGAVGSGRLAVRSSGLAEDLDEASFAGQYETVLGVVGEVEVLDAVRLCWRSAAADRVREYSEHRAVGQAGKIAVLVQRLIDAEAAGVAYSANPVTGNRDEAVVSAVRGLGERLVSGQSTPDEWVVGSDGPRERRRSEGAIDAAQAAEVAELARSVASRLGAPQDIEWAIAGGRLYLLQSRPITALPDEVSWEPNLPGGYLRNFRFGEWLGDPVTPLFETWLLHRMERRAHQVAGAVIGMEPHEPAHIVVNGWYFYSMEFIPGQPLKLLAMMLTRVLPRFLVHPRRTAIALPPISHLGVDNYIREWRERVLPRHLAQVSEAAAAAAMASPTELVSMLDNLADGAGEYFASLMCVAGQAAKSEVPLGRFYNEHLYSRLGGSYAELLQGLFTPAQEPYGHAVQSLDWYHPTLAEMGLETEPAAAAAASAERRQTLAAEREAAESRARVALLGTPRLRRRFERLLAGAQRFQPLREEHVSYLTLGWPVMRQGLARMGGELARLGVISDPRQVYFLRRDEVLAALAGNSSSLAAEAKSRRLTWDRQGKLAAPLVVGKLSRVIKGVLRSSDEATRTPGANRQGLLGAPASPGRATGSVRVVRSMADFERLLAGEVLVAPATTPAWTPLFARAAAVVTDTGGVSSHASQVAREYGIPAVVGTGDGTSRLIDGQVVTVDGGAGLVET